MKAGRWIAASYILGRDVLVDEPYPHVCGLWVDARMTPGLRVQLWRRECAACIQEQHEDRAPPAELPPISDELRAIEARRMGERED